MALSEGQVGTVNRSRLLHRLQRDVANIADANSAVATGDVVLTFDASDSYAPKYTTAAELQASNSNNLAEIVATTNVITAAETGTTFFLNLAGGFTSTLPAPALGLRYRFIVMTAPTTNYVIATNGGANIMVVSVNELETDTTEDGPSDDDADTLNFVANVALPGDYVDVFCDGTKWYALGQTRADGAVTTSTT